MGEVQETFPLGLQHLACSTSSTSISSLIPRVCVCFTFLLQMPETAKVNNDFTCAFIFKNKLNVPLDNCKLMVEGLGIFKMATFDEG